MNFIYATHSYLRWIIVVMAIIALARFLVVWMGKAESGGLDRSLMSMLVGMMDLQLLLGVAVFIWLGTAGGGSRFEHATTMLLAVIAGHISAKWKNAPGQLRARNYFFIVLLMAVLIFVGVMRLDHGHGWTRSMPGL